MKKNSADGDYPAGFRFGRWETLEPIARPHHIATVRCRCDCGKERSVGVRSLVRGRSLSCGCLAADVRVPHKTHGAYGTPAHVSWSRMLCRCTNPAADNYHHYGGRGISVCERWRKFENFLADMGPRPSLDYSLERIDNNGNYEPGNCKWIPKKEQGRNRRGNVYVEVEGKKMLVTDVSREYAILPETLRRRLAKGMTADEALSQYYSGWNLSSIPDELIISEAARRNGRKGGRKPRVDPETEDERKARREYMRTYRETRRTLEK